MRAPADAAAAAAGVLPSLSWPPSSTGEATTYAPARVPLPSTVVEVREAMLRFIGGEALDPALTAFLLRILAAVAFYEGALDDERLERALDRVAVPGL